MITWTIERLGAAIRGRRVTAGEIVEACLTQIERVDPRLRAFISVDADRA